MFNTMVTTDEKGTIVVLIETSEGWVVEQECDTWEEAYEYQKGICI